MKTSLLLVRTLAPAIILFLSAGSSVAESYTWTGGSGEWSVNTNWNPVGIPGTGDTVTIESGTVSVTGEQSVGTLNLSGATLTGDGTLAITSGGTLTSSTQRGNGATVIATEATVTFGDGDHKLSNRTLQIEGTVIHSGTGTFNLEAEAPIVIEAGGVLDLASDATWKYSSGGPPTITNNGTLLKSAGTGESVIDLWNRTVLNTGTLSCLSGTLRIADGVSGTGGTYHAAGDGHILVKYQSDLTDVSFTGDGVVDLNFGWGGLTLNGTCTSTSALINRIVVTGEHTLQGSWTLVGATLQNGITTISCGSVLVLEGDTDLRLSSHLLDNSGIVRHTGAGKMLLSSATVENRSTGLIDLQSDADWAYSGSSAPVINNAGTFRKSGGTDVSYLDFHWIDKKLNNTGRIECLSGTLDFWQGLQGGGTVHAGTGGQVLLKGGCNVTDINFTGPGRVYAPSGNHSFNGHCYSNNFELNGGILMGTHELSGIWRWSSGAFGLQGIYSDGGTTTFAEDCWLRIVGESNHLIDRRALTCHGIIEHAGTGPLTIKDYSSFTSTDSATIILESVTEWRDGGATYNASPVVIAGTVLESRDSDVAFTFFSFEDTATHIPDDSWIQDPEHGWLWITGISNGSTFAFDLASTAWTWVPFYYYPVVYRFGTFNAWTYHVEGTATPDRWCYVFGESPLWIAEADWTP